MPRIGSSSRPKNYEASVERRQENSMPRPRFLLTVLFVATSLWITVVFVSAGAVPSAAAEHYSATMINVNNGAAGRIDITVDRWSSDAHRNALLATARQHA